MTAPTVTASTNTDGSTATANPTIAMPAAVNAGDYLVALIRADNEEAFTWPAGWNLLLTDASDGSDDQTGCRYKVADGTEDGTNISLSRTNSGKYAAISYAIGGATNIELGGFATGASASPATVDFSPSGGSQDYLFLWMGGWEGEQTSPPSGTPGGGIYAFAIGGTSGTAGAVTTNVKVASARRSTLATTTQTGTSWSISASDQWTTFVIALWTPAAGGGGGDVAPYVGGGLYPMSKRRSGLFVPENWRDKIFVPKRPKLALA